MKTVKQDVRFQAESFEKIRQIALHEKATIQDTIRKLCDIGIEKTLSDKTPSLPLSPIEEEMLHTLKSILTLTNVLTVKTLDIEKSGYDSFDVLAASIKNTASELVQKFKDKQR